MTSETSGAVDRKAPSGAAVWSGRIISALIVAVLLLGAAMNFAGVQQAVEGLQKLGYPEGSGFGIAVAVLISAIAYAIPQTSVLGAILLTGYLGGAVATHIRAGEGWGATVPAFGFGVLVWVALLLRNRRLRELLPLTK